jgi:NAD(P)H dehydrogenase (quinone)
MCSHWRSNRRNFKKASFKRLKKQRPDFDLPSRRAGKRCNLGGRMHTTTHQPGAITSPILVTGAAGQVGSVGFKIVELLRGKGVPVRAMVRRHDDRSQALANLGAEIVTGDLTELSDVSRVMEGCQRLYFGMSVSSSYLEATVNTAAVAKHYGVELFLNISQMTVSEMSISETTSSPQQKLHWLCEQALNWSGLPVVHVRPTVFLENPFFYNFAVETIRRTGELQLPFGSGRTSPIAAQDVARVMAEILISPAAHLGRIYEFTGPKAQDLNAIAEEYAKGLGRTVQYRAMTWDEWADRYLKGSGLPEHVSNHLATMALRQGENRYDRLTHDVETVTGTKPMAIEDWVRAHARTFQGEQ